MVVSILKLASNLNLCNYLINLIQFFTKKAQLTHLQVLKMTLTPFPSLKILQRMNVNM